VKVTFIHPYDYVVEFSYHCAKVLMSIRFTHRSPREVVAIKVWRPKGSHSKGALVSARMSCSNRWQVYPDYLLSN
jgi:hypothetical protein